MRQSEHRTGLRRALSKSKRGRRLLVVLVVGWSAETSLAVIEQKRRGGAAIELVSVTYLQRGPMRLIRL
jgi:hypothetical protein